MKKLKMNPFKAKKLNDRQLTQIEKWLLRNEEARVEKLEKEFTFILDNVSKKALDDFERMFSQK